MTRSRLAVLALSTTAAISLNLLACGDGEDATTSSPPETTTSGAVEPTELRKRFEDQMRTVLGQQDAGVDADCVIEKLREDLPNATVEASVEAIEAGEEIPQEAVDAAFDAGRACR